MVKTLILKAKSTSGNRIDNLVREISIVSNIEVSLNVINYINSEITCNVDIINNVHLYDYKVCLLDFNPNISSHSHMNDLFNTSSNVFSSDPTISQVTNEEIKFSNLPNQNGLHAINIDSMYTPIVAGDYYISLRTFFVDKYISCTQRITVE